MANWKKATEEFFKHADPDGEYHHFTGNGVTDVAISSVESKIGIEFPPELRNFYKFSNGLGLSSNEQEAPRFIPPIGQLPSFVETARLFFSATHENIALRYLPVIDWANGDTAGYLLEPSGNFFPFIVNFMHEQYEGGESQDANDFLEPVAKNLLEFLMY